jgi:type I restriction enzyme S subunit
MNPELLLAHFNRISDVPDAISRLRQFVLELAVRGKLSNRDSRDEPASALLGRIQAERNRRVREGQMRKSGPLPEVKPEEVSFDIPENWHWARLGSISEVVMGQSPPGVSYNKSGEGIPLINGPVEFTEGPFGKTVINQYTTDPTNLCEEGDLLICVRGSTTGRTNIAGFRACIGRGVAAIRPLFADRYVRLFIWRQRASIIAMGRGIAFPSVSRQQIENLPVPLPSLAEQDRIVATVDDLMALCDRLELARNDREIRRDRLAAASLHHLNNGANAAEAFREHAHFFIRHLPSLTNRPKQIKQLRQTILNLAVCGKLVEQRSGDEPASNLLKRLRVERQRLVKKGKVKESGELLPLKPGDEQFMIPPTWQWGRFVEVAAIQSNLVKPNMYKDSPHIAPDNIESGTGRLLPYTTVEASGVFSAKHLFFPGCILYSKIRPALAKAVTVDFEGLCSADMYPILPFIDRRYLHTYMLSETFVQQSVSEDTRVAMPKINQAALSRIAVPVPPLAEQHRIVAKVEELMALCDHLEAQITTTQTQGRRLLESVLHRTLEPV